MTPLIVPLRSRRQQRVLLVQKLQHLFPAAVLLVAGFRQFVDEPVGLGVVIAIANIVIGLLMLGATLKTAYGSRHLLTKQPHAAQNAHHSHPDVEWENFLAAAMVLAEGLERRLHGGHHFPRPAILTAAVLVVTGLFHGRIIRAAERRRSLRVDADGIYVPGRRFKARRLYAKWADVASIDIGERWAVLKTRGGDSRKLDLADQQEEAAVRGALEEARRRFLVAPVE